MKQYSNRLLMVAPVAFRFNKETASNNYYQKVIEGLNPEETQSRALKEFNEFVQKIRAAGIEIIVIEDTSEPYTPDSIFPNNWVSFHESGTLVLFPMYAENRRQERRTDIIEKMRSKGLTISKVVDLTEAEEENRFLEGTGSMILDRQNRIAYAALSLRTEEELLFEFCRTLDFRPCVFSANQTVGSKRLPIYHTNVMMCIAEEFAVICLDSIDDLEERHHVIDTIEDTNKEIIEISEDQVEHFAGNMLQVGNSEHKYLIMSTAAYQSLDNEQIEKIESFCPIIHSALDTIEACGGGSARCMMAEVFLPKA